MIIKCIIIDDEPVALNIIERYLKRIEGFEVVGKFIDALEATNILKKERIDLIFLDIEMPKLDGLSFLKTLKNPPNVIITTAYRKYAIEGFELNVIDYLLKPISFERFLKAVNKVSFSNEYSEQKIEADYIYLRADNKMIQIPFDDINYIQSLSNYVRIFRDGRSIISYQKLSHLEKALPSSRFIRVHRSFIVPIKKIQSYTGAHVEVNGEEIPIGGHYKEHVVSTLEKFEA
ncbi:MAG: response regulator transcription factor [Balneolaceae bacterium]|nr:response regulator transcription factor [Balneolaceae bacterium]MBO6547832.1 response regulator transcription factor [Balneolaceae bacterium]MBO6648343.1 response regulator transcription factor [Balneolaceae bacterium]